MGVESVENLSTLYMLCRLIAQFCRACRWSHVLTTFSFVFSSSPSPPPLAKHQGEHFGFIITLGHMIIPVMIFSGGFRGYEGRKCNTGIVRDCLCEYKTRLHMWMNVLFVGRSCRVCWAKMAVIQDGWVVWSLLFVISKWYRLNHVRRQIQRQDLLPLSSLFHVGPNVKIWCLRRWSPQLCW
jgi:hypothetical protein